MLFGGKNLSYSGKDGYRHVERLIREGREICIISPYIDAYYAAFLRRYAGRKKFYIIASSMTDPARRILESRFRILGLLLFVGFVVLFDLAVYLFGFFSFYIALFSILAIAARWIAFRIWGGNKIKLKVPGEFVHVKLYASEKMAISGSANLTYNGMHKNVEHIDIVYDSARVKEFKKEFWRMWSRY